MLKSLALPSRTQHIIVIVIKGSHFFTPLPRRACCFRQRRNKRGMGVMVMIPAYGETWHCLSIYPHCVSKAYLSVSFDSCLQLMEVLKALTLILPLRTWLCAIKQRPCKASSPSQPTAKPLPRTRLPASTLLSSSKGREGKDI